MLEEIGFIPQLVKLIMFSVSSANLSLLWNNEKLRPFSPKRGLRQGDLLALYLFVLCTEALIIGLHKLLMRENGKEPSHHDTDLA